MRRILPIACALLLGAALLPSLRADEWDKMTVVNLKTPIEVPGVVLEPGTYVFKLADSQSDRNIVEIWNKDQTHLYTTLLAIPDYRLRPTGHTVLNFEERVAGAPQALKAWFYPGSLYGEEFVYPKPKAMEIAKRTNQPVFSMPAETKAQQAELNQAPVKAVTPKGQEVEMAKVMPPKPPAAQAQSATPAPSMAATTAPARHRLPKTASDEPLIAAIGLVALAAALGTRVLARQRA